MIQYLYTIPVLFLSVLCMTFLTATNEYLLPAHKKGFFIAFLGEIAIIIFEILSVFLNNSAIEFKTIHFLSNYLGFLLTPILIAIFAASIGRFHRLKFAMIGISAYAILYNILVATNQLFFIDAQNSYHRGNLFFAYIILYFCAVVYLLYEALRYSRKGFFRHKVFIALLIFCFLASTSIQVLNPEVYITRIAVVFNLCVYYAYNIGFTSLFDKLTGVLNQGTYQKKIKELKEQQIVVILDIDDFKHVNDNYGHQYGDKCLESVSQSAKTIFGNFGQCYRIGGDEFAIILKKNAKVDSLIDRFEKSIDEKFKDSPCKIYVSAGYSVCEKNESYEAVVQRADTNMYSIKNLKKATRAITTK